MKLIEIALRTVKITKSDDLLIPVKNLKSRVGQTWTPGQTSDGIMCLAGMNTPCWPTIPVASLTS